ncbi:hypothetical protein EOL94_04190 [bacterium]|nr:hypothetical protein [bacterium]
MTSLVQQTTSYKSEAFVQELIRDRDDVKKYIIDNLGFEYDGTEIFSREIKFINGITVDFRIVKDDKVIALLECKSGGIGVTDYVRGIGQLLQYEYFFEEGILSNGREQYSPEFKTIYFYPSDVIKNNNFNIARFKYPNSTKLLEVNIENFVVREVVKEELDKMKSIGSEKVAVSQYYFRDNRLFELFILLQYLKYLEMMGRESVDRRKLEEESLRKLETPNNSNWRNAFITLSSLGFISKDNLLSEAGKYISIKNYPQFCLEILNSYIKPYVELIFNVLYNNQESSLTELANEIELMYQGKKVLFVTDSDNRYLSSWLNILRDDYACIEFTSRSSKRKIVYNPTELKDSIILDKIAENEIANRFIDKFNKMLASNELL